MGRKRRFTDTLETKQPTTEEVRSNLVSFCNHSTSVGGITLYDLLSLMSSCHSRAHRVLRFICTAHVPRQLAPSARSAMRHST